MTTSPIVYPISPNVTRLARSAALPIDAFAVAEVRARNVTRIVSGVARGDILLRTWVAAKYGSVPAMTRPTSRSQSPASEGEVWENLYLDICPPSLQHKAPPGAPLVQLVRPGQRTPSTPTSRPLVYVTLGTVYARSDLFRAIFDGLAGEPVDVIVTIGSHGDPTALGSPPNNVRVERFVPQPNSSLPARR